MDYEVIRSDRKTISFCIADDKLIIRVPKDTTDKYLMKYLVRKQERIQKMVDKYEKEQARLRGLPPYTEEEIKRIRDEAKRVIPERVEYYAEKLDVTYNKVTIRCQRTVWGNCSESGNLSFNCLLVLMPSEVLDYIVAYELCYGKYGFSAYLFYKELGRVFPEHTKWKKWLKENGNLYLERLPKK